METAPIIHVRIAINRDLPVMYRTLRLHENRLVHHCSMMYIF